MAVADLGTNSTRLLVADVGPDGHVTEVERHSEVTRLGAGVDRTRRLDPEAVARVEAVLARYRDRVEHHGCDATAAVLTSAARDAQDGEALAARVRERHGFHARVIDGDEEARLTFAGAVDERPRAGRCVAVADVGGGSTEIVTGRDGAPGFHVSLQAGVVRHTERHLRTDPPRPGDLAALREEIAALVRERVPEAERSAAEELVAVAGTPTSLAAVDLGLEPYDPSRVHGRVVTRGRAEEILARLAALPLEERRRVPGLHPDRAPTVCAGVAILLEVLDAFGLDRLEASEHDLLRGTAVALAEGRWG